MPQENFVRAASPDRQVREKLVIEKLIKVKQLIDMSCPFF
jgi:hypothetical protein